MTLSLTKISVFIKIGLTALGITCIVIGYVVMGSRSCNRQPEEPVYSKWTRMGGTFHVEQDTTKKPPLQQKIVNHSYSLSGSDTLFNLLWLQLNSPIDITPRQLDNLKTWMQKNLKADTTHSK